tara:strand:- start:165 stop:389 length:225 start_codon:yes stop_codon:yes gene_type:complete
MKYKAKDSYKSVKNKHFNIGVVKCLLRGGSIVIDEKAFKTMPKEIQESLESAEKKKTKTKQVSKKDTIKTEGDK